MLTDIQIENNKKEFITLIKKITREGALINELLQKLENSDFYVAPASTQYHASYKGGLCQHSLNVYKQLKKLIEVEYPRFKIDDQGERYAVDNYKAPYSDETLIIVALLHDLSKMNFYEVSTRNVKDENGQWIQVPFIKVREVYERFTYSHHGANSEYMIGRFIPLTFDESRAIIHHMGWADEHATTYLISEVFEKCKLALYLHTADLLATYIDEGISE